MRILIVSPYFPPQNAVAARRVHAFACTWADAGHAVTVLTTPKRPDQHGFPAPSPGVNVVEVPFHVPRLLEHLRLAHKSAAPSLADLARPTDDPASPSSTFPSRPLLRALRTFRDYTGIFCSVRAPDLTDFWVRPAIAWAATHAAIHYDHERASSRNKMGGEMGNEGGGVRGGWDVVLSSSGPYTSHLVALAIKQRRLARCWVQDFRDLWTRNHLHHGLFPFSLREYHIESRILRSADLISTVSKPLAHHLASRSPAPVEIIYNGFDPDTFADLPHDPLLNSRADQINLVYAGTFYPAGQNPAPLLHALAIINDHHPDLAPRFRLHVAGQGASHWLSLAQKIGVSGSLHLHGLLSRTNALRLTRDASALLFLDWHDPSAGVLTGKIFEYLAASATILALGPHAHSPLGSLLRLTRRGRYLGNNPSHIARAILDLAASPSLSLPPPDHALINTFTRREQSLKLLNCISSFTHAPS